MHVTTYLVAWTLIISTTKATTITAGNKEQSINTEAAISCVVTGLSAALNVDNIIWKDDDETEITNDDGSEFFIDIGTYNEGTQTSTLTVPAAQTSTPTDKVFTCLITPSEEGASQLSETVNLKLYSLTSETKSVTTTSEQTLTCTISNLDQDHAVTVTWTDQNDVQVSASDTSNYALNSGSVDADRNQAAILTIKQVKMETYKSTFTYKCSVKSTQYPESPPSPKIDVVVNISEDQEKEEEDSGVSPAVIVGAVGGGVVFVAGAGAAAVFIYKKFCLAAAVGVDVVPPAPPV